MLASVIAAEEKKIVRQEQGKSRKDTVTRSRTTKLKDSSTRAHNRMWSTMST
jgi:hypothetical protein